MSRAVKPAKLDSKIYNSMAPGLHDGFGGLMVSAITTGGAGWAAFALMASSLYFLLLLLIPAVVVSQVVTVYRNTVWQDGRLYGQAYRIFTSITDPDSRSDAKMLLENIWKHEQMTVSSRNRHVNKYDCESCHKRYELIIKIQENQPFASIDGSDIEQIEEKLKARTKIASDDRRMLRA